MGNCKFGATCKFHHPKDGAGITGSVQLNSFCYPPHPDEKQCAYYMRTGQCKFGITCKFHHPQPSDVMVSLCGSSVYNSVHSPTTSVRQSYSGGLANWPMSRASYIPSSHWQGLLSYAQLILPQGLVQVPSWNTFSGQLGSESSPENQQATKSETTQKTQGTFSSYISGSVPLDQHAVQKDNILPERSDQPECQFYMKSGDCKFGAICRFHHSKERFLPAPGCVLTPLGLPLRSGEPLCIFYSHYGICKFDHLMETSMGGLAYSLPTSSSLAVPPVQRLLGSSMSPRSGSRQITSEDENIKSDS